MKSFEDVDFSDFGGEKEYFRFLLDFKKRALVELSAVEFDVKNKSFESMSRLLHDYKSLLQLLGFKSSAEKIRAMHACFITQISDIEKDKIFWNLRTEMDIVLSEIK